MGHLSLEGKQSRVYGALETIGRGLSALRRLRVLRVYFQEGVYC